MPRRRFFLLDFFLEIGFWIGALAGALFGLAFAQRKGKTFRQEIAEHLEKKDFTALRKHAGGEIRRAGAEAWQEAKKAATRCPAGKDLKKKSRESWEKIDPELRAKVAGGARTLWQKISLAARELFARAKARKEHAAKEIADTLEGSELLAEVEEKKSPRRARSKTSSAKKPTARRAPANKKEEKPAAKSQKPKAAKQKAAALLLPFLLAGNLAGCDSLSNLTGGSLGDSFEGENFSISFPERFLPIPEKDLGPGLLFGIVDLASSESLATNVTIHAEELTDPEITPLRFALANIRQARESLAGFKEKEVRELKIAGEETRILRFAIEDGAGRIDFDQLFFAANGRGFVVTATAAGGLSEERQLEILEILESFAPAEKE
jgi:gas vesicle protein